MPIDQSLDWIRRFGELEAEWQQLVREDPVDISAWETTFDEMFRSTEKLKSAGRWRSGSRTLLRELGIDHLELLMCRGVAWLLRPDGWHGLGDRFLRGFLAHLELPTDQVDYTSVRTEEPRGLTRADIVVRTPTSTIVVEAKTGSLESPRQCALIAEAWEQVGPTLVFLSPGGPPPKTADASADSWKSLSWLDLGRIARRAASGVAEPSSGALEFIETLEYQEVHAG